MKYVITPGATSQSVQFHIYKDDGTANTSLVYNSASLAVSYKRDNGTLTSITLATLASDTAAYSSGGFVHIGGGLYRLDLPNAAIASGATNVQIVVTEATDIRAEPCQIELYRKPVVTASGYTQSDLWAVQSDPNAAVKLALALYGWSGSTTPDTQASTGLYNLATAYFNTSRLAADLTHIGGTAISFVAGDLTTARLAKLDNLDATIASRHASGAAVASVTGNVGGNVVGSVGSVTAGVSLANGAITADKLAADALLAIANKVEAEIIDETDSEKVLSAITDKIAAVNPDLGGLTVAAIASAARDAVLNAVLAGNFDTAGSLGKLAQFLDASVASVKAKTDNLPDDPADASVIAAAFTSLAGDVSSIDTNLTNVGENVDNIWRDLSQVMTMTEGVDADRKFTTTAVSNVSGSLTTDQSTQLAALAATLESSGVFSDAALANAPASNGGGGGTGATIEEIQALLVSEGITDISVRSTVASDGTLEFDHGMAYTAATGNAYTLPAITDYDGPDLDGEEVTLRLLKTSNYERSGDYASADIEVTGTAAQSGTTLTLAFNIADTDWPATLSTFPPDGDPTHRAQVWALGIKRKLVDTTAVVRRAIGAAE